MFYFKDDPALEKAEPAFIKNCKTSSWWLICWDEARSKETWRAYNVRTSAPGLISPLLSI